MSNFYYYTSLIAYLLSTCLPTSTYLFLPFVHPTLLSPPSLFICLCIPPTILIHIQSQPHLFHNKSIIIIIIIIMMDTIMVDKGIDKVIDKVINKGHQSVLNVDKDVLNTIVNETNIFSREIIDISSNDDSSDCDSDEEMGSHRTRVNSTKVCTIQPASI